MNMSTAAYVHAPTDSAIDLNTINNLNEMHQLILGAKVTNGEVVLFGKSCSISYEVLMDRVVLLLRNYELTRPSIRINEAAFCNQYQDAAPVAMTMRQLRDQSISCTHALISNIFGRCCCTWFDCFPLTCNRLSKEAYIESFADSGYRGCCLR